MGCCLFGQLGAYTKCREKQYDLTLRYVGVKRCSSYEQADRVKSRGNSCMVKVFPHVSVPKYSSD